MNRALPGEQTRAVSDSRGRSQHAALKMNSSRISLQQLKSLFILQTSSVVCDLDKKLNLFHLISHNMLELACHSENCD